MMTPCRWGSVVRGSRAGLLAIALGLVVAPSCAPKTVPAGAAPKYPDFLFPAVPPSFNQPDLASRHQRAWSLLQAGDLKGSTKEFAAILKKSPGFFPAETALGYAALGRNDQSDALEWFDRALTRTAGYSPALVGRGQVLLSLNKEADALASFEAALTADPTLDDIRRRVEVLRFRNVQESVQSAQRAAAAGQWADAKREYETAIAASPDSAFLYRELGAIERRTGETEAALEHFRRAAQLDSTDAASYASIGDILAERNEFDQAIEAYRSAQANDSSPEIEARMESARAKSETATLPREYQAIEGAEGVTRAQLAALIGVKLKALVESAGRRDTVLITDARDSWAASWIQLVTSAAIMEVFPNHTFQPRVPVRRADLAHAVSRLLNLIGGSRPDLVGPWKDARPAIADVGPDHLSYSAAALAVSSGVLPLLEGGEFGLSRSVSGAEAISAIDRLQALASSNVARD
jgi:tetratricopeptide (TPR) repeat protein